MKGSKFFSALFGILGILLMVVTAAVSIASRNAQPRMLESPEARLGAGAAHDGRPVRR